MQDAPNGGVVHAALRRDGADRPLLDKVEPKDLLLDVVGDHASHPERCAVGAEEPAPGEGSDLSKTEGTRQLCWEWRWGVAFMRVLLGPDRDGDRVRCTWPRWGGWGTVVRHLRGATLEIALLRGGVMGSARRGTLIAAVCAAPAVPPCSRAAGGPAVAVAAVAGATQADLGAAAGAGKQSVFDDVALDRATPTCESLRGSADWCVGPRGSGVAAPRPSPISTRDVSPRGRPEAGPSTPLRVAEGRRLAWT